MKYAFPLFFALLLLTGCGQGDTRKTMPVEAESPERNVEESPVNTAADTERSDHVLSGIWNLAVLIDENWWQVEGCEEHYGLSIQMADNVVVLVDRVGLSAELWNIRELKMNADNTFLLHTDQEFTFEGHYFDEQGSFKVPAIKILNQRFKDLYRSELGLNDEPEEMLLFKPDSGNRPSFLHDVMAADCPDFDEEMTETSTAWIEDGIDDEELTEQKILELLAWNSIAFNNSEYCTVNFLRTENRLVLITDCQEGDYSDVSLYAINAEGRVSGRKDYHGVFQWLSNGKKYRLNADGNIHLEPGDWKFNEKEERMDLVTETVELYVNADFEFEVKSPE